MADTARVTITLAADLVEDIDRLERNRSRFIAEAVAHELTRRRHAALLRSIRSPHADTVALVERRTRSQRRCWGRQRAYSIDRSCGSSPGHGSPRPVLSAGADIAERERGRGMVEAALTDFRALEMVLHANLAERFLREGR